MVILESYPQKIPNVLNQFKLRNFCTLNKQPGF